MSERLTAERERFIRAAQTGSVIGAQFVNELLAELDATRKERDLAQTTAHQRGEASLLEMRQIKEARQQIAQLQADLEYLNLFTAKFADKLIEFGTVDRMLEEYSAYKMKCRNLEAERDALKAEVEGPSE